MTVSPFPITHSPQTASQPAWSRIDLLILPLLAAILLIVFSGALLLPYGMLDDYSWLYYAHIPSYRSYIFDSLAVQGRPLNGWITTLIFHHIFTIRALTGVRVLTILGLAGMIWTLYLALIRAGWPQAQSFFVSLIAGVVPSMQVHAAWACSAPIPIAGIAAASAALLCGWCADHLERRWPALLATAALVLVACTIYQPAAMIFWPIALLDCFSPNHTNRRIIPRAAVYLLTAGAGLFAGWIVFKIGLHAYPNSAQPDRTGFTLDPVEKARQFALMPLTDNFAIFFLDPSRRACAIVALLLTIGLLLYFPGDFRRRIAFVLVSYLLFPLADLPNLLAQTNSWAYRTQMGMAWLMIVLCWLAINGFWKFLTASPRPFPWPLLAVLAVACSFSAAWNVTRLIAWPQSVELAVLQTKLSEANADSADRVILLMPGWNDSPASFCRYDEFGKPTLTGPTMCYPMINILCGRLGPDKTRIRVRTVDDWQGPWTKPLKPGVVLVDMRELHLTKWSH